MRRMRRPISDGMDESLLRVHGAPFSVGNLHHGWLFRFLIAVMWCGSAHMYCDCSAHVYTIAVLINEVHNALP